MSSMWYRLMVAAVIVGGLHLVLTGQEQKGPPADKGKKAKLFDFGGGPTGKAASGGILDALRDKKVQEEIGLVPEQVEELQFLSEQVAFELQPLLREFQSLPKDVQEATMEEFRRQVADRLRTIERDLDRILLPEQQRRLRQMALQLRMKKGGTSAALTSPDVARQLGMSDEQAVRLREAIVKIEEKYKEKLLDLQVDMEREILDLFTPAQQEKLKSMIGPMMSSLPKFPDGSGPKGGPPR